MGEYKDEELYNMGKMAGWAATIAKLVYIVVNFSIWKLIRVVPDLIVLLYEMAKEFDLGDIVPEDIYKLVFNVVYTHATAGYMGDLVGFVLGFVLDPPGLPVMYDENFYTAAFPTSFSFEKMYIMKTLSWYLKLASIALKELGGPLLDKCFGELDIIYAIAWDAVNDLLYDFYFSFDAVIGNATWMLPWYAVGWFVFDGEVDDF